MDEAISQFSSITGEDASRAKFFVESAGGNVETALSTFYENEGTLEEGGGEGQGAAAVPDDTAAAAAAAATGPRTLSGEPASAEPASWARQTATGPSTRKSAVGSSGQGGFATLRDMQGSSASANDDDSDDSEGDDSKDPAKFFTGGERSGLNVQNPDRKRGNNAPEVVQNILKKAADAGQKMPDQESGSSSTSRGRAAAAALNSSFTGQGRTINDEEGQVGGGREHQGGSNAPTPSLPGLIPSLQSGAPPPGNSGDNDEEEEVAIRNITFWQDGFSIADGPLCRYDDPQHAETLALINTNRAPLSLLNVRFGQPVELRVERRTNEKYQPPPPPPMKPFGGEGNRLGAPVPAMQGQAASSGSGGQQQQQQPAASAAASTPQPSSTMFQVDGSQPTTQVQIRLGDGERMVAKLNHTHTVADVRQYINSSHPGMANRSYTLQSSFPPKPLTDETLTLKEAGLINAVIIQKWS